MLYSKKCLFFLLVDRGELSPALRISTVSTFLYSLDQTPFPLANSGVFLSPLSCILVRLGAPAPRWTRDRSPILINIGVTQLPGLLVLDRHQPCGFLLQATDLALQGLPPIVC